MRTPQCIHHYHRRRRGERERYQEDKRQEGQTIFRSIDPDPEQVFRKKGDFDFGELTINLYLEIGHNRQQYYQKEEESQEHPESSEGTNN